MRILLVRGFEFPYGVELLSTDPVHQDAYLRASATLPTVTVHLGHFLTKPVTMPLANPARGGAKFV